MRKIIFVFLFFCLAITTVLAQVVTTNIAAPDSNGLSDNQVDDFDVDTEGTILNNSAVDGTAQLRDLNGTSTDVIANPNITAGSEASLILFQVTSPSNTSTLNGAIEVFGGEAGIIIANPNGIECSGCAFINANRVDLVTGTYNTDTGTFDGISNDITVTSFGLDASSVGILNIQTTNFTNDGIVNADTFNLSVDVSFDNNAEISANTFNLSAAGNFFYDDAGTITTTNDFNLNVGGDFRQSVANDFTWATNDSLTVLGTAFINTNNYAQYGVINVAGAWTIITNLDFTYSNANNDFIWAPNDLLRFGRNADITTNNFANSGSINTNTGSSLNITAGYTVINHGSINVPSLNVTAADFFRNLAGGNIDVASLNIVAGGKVTNTDTIDVSGILSITANNDSSRNNDPTGFYVSNRGNITAGNFSIEAIDNFYNRGNITTTGTFTTSAKDIFLLNEEIDSYDSTYDGGTITLGGVSGLITNAGIIENYGNIDLGDVGILTIVADSFTNQAGATISDGTVDITVTSFINDGSADSAIITVNGATIDTTY